ncbi:hypothetical protein K440DRAFT_568201 [Wilcoxina mikolae CBS 423.85]|nr:hypothetical protein K440DRAFT_568201 [Wilcoxina mikolae CBS 423.85]
MVSGRLISSTGNPQLPDKGGGGCGALTPRVLNLQQRLNAEEEKFRKMCDCIPRMIWTTTPGGEHDYFSKRWYEYTGLTPELCLGSGWQTGYHPDDIGAVNEKWKQSIATGDGYSAEYRFRRSDGEHRWMLGRAVPLKDPETGKVLKWYGTATDIHDMVEARTAEKATREQLTEANLTTGGIIWQTRDNPGYYIGKDIKDIFDEIDPNDKYHHQFLEPIDLLLRGEISEGFTETELDGHWFKTKYVPMKKGPSGKNDAKYVTGIIGLSMDMTKMHATELELRERERQNRILLANENAAKEASKLKSDFLASMSHEIRTPIAGVVGMCEILLDTALSSEQRELTEGIQRSANALLTVINDILDLSKVESGKLDIEEVQFNLSLVIRDVVKMLSFEAERKKLQFKYDIDFPCPNDLTVMGDPGRVRQILANLLSNALKFTHEGSVELKARMKHQDDETMEIHFVVNDTGIGILETDQCRLFQPFTQADSSTARRFGGTGLGLSICQKLVTLMGGTIGLSSKAGEGTSAYFSIPFKKITKHSSTRTTNFDSIPERLQSDTSVNVSPPPPPKLTNTPPSPPTEHLPPDIEFRRKRHVLIVDDNEINQQIAIRLIKKLHFTVSAVCNGLECLSFIKSSSLLPSSFDTTSSNPPYLRRPDVILMDVQMPEMDGYAATRAIRREGGWLKEVPIVALTASAIKGDREKCRDAGMDDYLSKPVNGRVLEKMLVKWCFKDGCQREEG